MSELQYFYWILVICNIVWYIGLSIYSVLKHKRDLIHSLIMSIENMNPDAIRDMRKYSSQLNIDYETSLIGTMLLSVLIPFHCFVKIFKLIYNYFNKENKNL